MADENLEVVRRTIASVDGFLRREVTREAAADTVDPQFAWNFDERTLPDFPQHLEGAQQGLEALDQMRSAWDALSLEALEVEELRDGRVLTLTRVRGRGRESGVPIVFHYFQLWTNLDGKVVKTELFRHRADALEAPGLQE